MPIDFPDSPSINDIHTVGDRSWVYTTTGIWDSVTSLRSIDDLNDVVITSATTNQTLVYSTTGNWVNAEASGGSASDSFTTIAVSGQGSVVADSTTDTLTLVGGTYLSITTDTASDTITFTPANLATVNTTYTAGTGLTLTTTTFSVTPNTYQPLDADLTAIAELAGTLGFLKKTEADTWTLDTNTYITGNESITVSGDASGSGTTSISLTLATTGVTAGTYNSVTVDTKGRVTAGTNIDYSTTGHTHAIDDLSDVVITTATTNQTLVYSTTGNWVNATPAAGGVTAGQAIIYAMVFG